MYGKVLSAAVVPAAIVLPNTGSNRALAIVAGISLVVGIVALVSTFGRTIAKRAFKA